MRRRNMSTAISLAAAPRPSDIESAIDARLKLQVAIEEEKSKGETADIEFARIFSKGIYLVQVVDADVALQENEARKARAERARQRIEALESILATVNKFIEQLKVDSPDAVYSALTRKLEALERALSEKECDGKNLDDQISKLKTEISKLSKTYAKKA